MSRKQGVKIPPWISNKSITGYDYSSFDQTEIDQISQLFSQLDQISILRTNMPVYKPNKIAVSLIEQQTSNLLETAQALNDISQSVAENPEPEQMSIQFNTMKSEIAELDKSVHESVRTLTTYPKNIFPIEYEDMDSKYNNINNKLCLIETGTVDTIQSPKSPKNKRGGRARPKQTSSPVKFDKKFTQQTSGIGAEPLNTKPSLGLGLGLGNKPKNTITTKQADNALNITSSSFPNNRPTVGQPGVLGKGLSPASFKRPTESQPKQKVSPPISSKDTNTASNLDITANSPGKGLFGKNLMNSINKTGNSQSSSQSQDKPKLGLGLNNPVNQNKTAQEGGSEPKQLTNLFKPRTSSASTPTKKESPNIEPKQEASSENEVLTPNEEHSEVKESDKKDTPIQAEQNQQKDEKKENPLSSASDPPRATAPLIDQNVFKNSINNPNETGDKSFSINLPGSANNEASNPSNIGKANPGSLSMNGFDNTSIQNKPGMTTLSPTGLLPTNNSSPTKKLGSPLMGSSLGGIKPPDSKFSLIGTNSTGVQNKTGIASLNPTGPTNNSANTPSKPSIFGSNLGGMKQPFGGSFGMNQKPNINSLKQDITNNIALTPKKEESTSTTPNISALAKSSNALNQSQPEDKTSQNPKPERSESQTKPAFTFNTLYDKTRAQSESTIRPSININGFGQNKVNWPKQNESKDNNEKPNPLWAGRKMTNQFSLNSDRPLPGIDHYKNLAEEAKNSKVGNIPKPVIKEEVARFSDDDSDHQPLELGSVSPPV